MARPAVLSSFTLPLLCLGSCFLLPATVSAKDMARRFGLGGQRSLTGYSGVHAKYFVHKHWSIDVSMGLAVFKPSDEDGINDNAEFSTAVAPGFNYWIIPARQAGPIEASFGIGGRFGFYVFYQDEGPELVEVDFELPLVAEVFLGDHFSLAPEFGLVFRVPVGDDGGYYENRKGFGMFIGDNTGLFGGGGFNFYF